LDNAVWPVVVVAQLVLIGRITTEHIRLLVWSLTVAAAVLAVIGWAIRWLTMRGVRKLQSEIERYQNDAWLSISRARSALDEINTKLEDLERKKEGT
jgi:hypothetical protein